MALRGALPSDAAVVDRTHAFPVDPPVPRRYALAGDVSPVQAVRWLRADPRPVALVGEWLEAAAVLGSWPAAIAGPDEDVFALLDAQRSVPAGPVRVGGGWIGWLGYGLGAQLERLPPAPPAPIPRPRFSLAFYDHVIVRCGDGWWFEQLWTAERDAFLASRLAVWRSRFAQGAPRPRRVAVSPMRIAGNGPQGHLAAVTDCRRRIAAGELYQANLCLRLEGTVDGDPVDLFSAAVGSGAARFAAMVDGAVSLSPERFLRRAGERVSTEPIKGTRPRHGLIDEPEVRNELEVSAKDAAEHVMIVDLMRNDLGRVCRYGSIRAHDRHVEAHAGVWHLVSEVSGRLREGVGDGTLLRATFPPGSVTGAPKVQAMKVISELESTRRELYTGAIGIASPVAGLDLSVAIRTFEIDDGRVWFGAGGGIVADSDPALELAEAIAKATGPLRLIGGRLTDQPPKRSDIAQVPRALAYGQRPDPDAGVFETILVQDGRPLALQAHLARLAASLRALYGRAPADDLHEQIRDALRADEAARARMRILSDRAGATTVTTTPAPIPAEHQELILTPVLLPGGLGAHKWTDRSLLHALTQQAPGTVPLLIDTDGNVLEAGHANVWILQDGAWITPPADGRILPGITRASTLAHCRSAREEPISLDRLQNASAILLTSSITGAHRARIADTQSIAPQT